ncbi:MAG: TorF family putative porin [Pseudomonadota bacterium]|nr:TorF family putative porin [Pseudomonadota bacterium]
MKRTLPCAVAASAVALGLGVSAPASAEVSASASLATIYLWRGQDVSMGGAQFAADLMYGHESGAYGGIWISSEDEGIEYDLFAGWSGTFEDFGVDVSVWNYIYPSDAENDSFGDLTEVILTLSYMDFAFSYYDNIAGDTGYTYYTLSGGYDQFSALVGFASPDDSDSEYVHLDLTYAYNDNLSFTASTVVDKPDDESLDGDTLFVASYSVPIDL